MTDSRPHNEFHQLPWHPLMHPLFIPWTWACPVAYALSNCIFMPQTLLVGLAGRLEGTLQTWEWRVSIISQFIGLFFCCCSGDSRHLMCAAGILPHFQFGQIDFLSKGREDFISWVTAGNSFQLFQNCCNVTTAASYFLPIQYISKIFFMNSTLGIPKANLPACD